MRRERDTLLASVATLGYSRAPLFDSPPMRRRKRFAAAYVRHLSVSAVCRAKCRFDNAKTVVVERDAYGEGSTTVSTARDVSGLEIRRNAFRLQRFGVGVPCTKTRVPHDVSNRAHNSTDHSGEG